MRFCLLLFCLVPTAARAQEAGMPTLVEGVFSAASDTLTGGEYKHVVEVEARAGEHLVAVMTSDDVDPYLIVRSPTGAQTENDDCAPGDRTRACVDWVADTTGTFRVIATTFARGETGAFGLAAGVRGSARAYACPPLPADDGLAGSVEYAVLFAPDGSYLGSTARTSAPALQIAADRVVSRCHASPLPADAPQEPQAIAVTFRADAE